ncbi:MAG: tRNA (adenosine(37)-N6)-threonylcarbamoyltransferase complex dimerization subunit type 1 TsaB [Prevotellaceae bacterium]|jgi:tRNA threonylcarbamoyladenosine biosynthesis protein TsaB|nr:tRNA (adenosine(37)-N6)-threonylcarbamoyltransferase complex dimerization subunit type 1 TsaB [Prevotellaceae bacterium]
MTDIAGKPLAVAEPLILCLETGGDICSVALARGGETVALRESREREHAECLSTFIDEILEQFGVSYKEIDAVAVSAGPGSYTGLRIGTATAKGICYGADKPLIAIDSLLSLATLCERSDPDAIYCPMIDARRQEVYTALFDASTRKLRATMAVIVTEDSFAEILDDHRMCFFGSGAAKCGKIIVHPNAAFVNVESSAAGLSAPAAKAYANQRFENSAYYEPFYLKDFVATTRGKKSITAKNK